MLTTEASRYLAERILQPRVGLIWLWVLAAALLTVGDPLDQLPWLALTSALFIVAFRLWDDLADLEYDRRRHPRRCLARSTDVRPFHAAVWLMAAGVAGLLLYVAGGARAAAFLVLVAAFSGMYRATARRPRLRPLRAALVVAKYPACVLLLADAPGDPATLLIALGAYLPPLLEESWGTGPGVILAAALLGLAALAWLALKA